MIIRDITVETRTSKKTGNNYNVLKIAYNDGKVMDKYDLELFISNEQAYLVDMWEKRIQLELQNQY